MVQKTGISNDWLERYRSDYKQMFEYIDSKSPEELFNNLIISDEVVVEVKRLMVEALIEDYNIGDNIERSELFKKFDYLLSVSEQFEDKYDFFGFVYLFSRVMDELRFSKTFRDSKTISTTEILTALKEILSFYNEDVAVKLIGLFTRAEGTLHNRIYQFSKVLTDIVNNKALSTHPLTSWIHLSNYSPFRNVCFKITFDGKNKNYLLNENIETWDSSEELITSYFIAKPGQIKVFKNINVLTLERFNSRKSLDFLGEIFSEYLKRFVCEDYIGSEYFLRDMFLKYPNILMEIILKDSRDIFKNNLDKFINSKTCKISLLRHGGNLPVYVDLKEDDHTKYRYL